MKPFWIHSLHYVFDLGMSIVIVFHFTFEKLILFLLKR